jgi:sugar lactone lactonase YvrE
MNSKRLIEPSSSRVTHALSTSIGLVQSSAVIAFSLRGKKFVDAVRSIHSNEHRLGNLAYHKEDIVPIQLHCTNCGHTQAGEPHSEGASQCCPQCGKPLTLPHALATEPSSGAAAIPWWVAAPAQTDAIATATSTGLLPSLPESLPPEMPVGNSDPARTILLPVLAGGATLAVVALAITLLILVLPPRQTAESGQPVVVASVTETATSAPTSQHAPIETEPTLNAPVSGLLQREGLTVLPRPQEVIAQRPPLEKPVSSRPAAGKPSATKPSAPEKLVVKRRHETTEDDLRKQIANVPEITLYRVFTSADAIRTQANAILAARMGTASAETSPPRFLARADLAGLPMRMGTDCKLNPDAADHLQGGSVALRAHLTQSRAGAGAAGLVPGAPGGGATDPRPDPKILHNRLHADRDRFNKWLKPEAIPVMQQMLMAENEAIREILIEQLSGIKGSSASVALAQRALYDLHPRIREQALEALQKRPVAEYRKVLLDGFLYPWPAVAEHAAEAVIALGLKDAVPDLLAMLDRPEPNAVFEKPGRGQYVRELIKINHPRNCLLCHAQSIRADDKVRGQVPTTDQSLTPPYYGGTNGTFVRADITYLKQDFSIPLTVENPGHWPNAQRFDFLVRERRATTAEIAASQKPAAGAPVSQQKQSLFFALRELTGADPGPAVEDWKRLFVECELKVNTTYTGFKGAGALAVDHSGCTYVADEGEILRMELGGKPSAWMKDTGDTAGLALDAKGQLLAARARTARVVRIDPATRESQVLANMIAGKRFNGPRRLIADNKGGVYFSDDPPVTGDGAGAVYYISAHGSVTRLTVGLSHPSAIGLSPDGKRLYVASSRAAKVMAFPIASAGVIGKGSLFCTPESPSSIQPGVADLTVDSDGLVHILNPATRGLEAFTPQGLKAGSARLPGVPVACALGGAGKRGLYVLTRTALLTVEVNRPAHVRMASR